MIGRWSAVHIGRSGPTDYDHAVEYASPFTAETHRLMVAGAPVAFTTEEAAVVVAILNKQIDDTAEMLMKQIGKGEYI